ncbi:MAG TPA: hypothetical protein VNY52_04085 [Solirubrobacteraceae bacterium]|nr:hypothetical protein [Solirubrobacteraceae bacterium]
MTGAALTEAVKLVFDQTQKLLGFLGRRREKGADAQPAAITSPVLRGELRDAVPNLDRVAAYEEVLKRIVGELSLYTAEADPGKVEPLLDAARAVLEDVYGRTITFAWESDRQATGARVEGRVQADLVHGKLLGVGIESVTEGDVKGTAVAGEVEAGGEVTGVKIKHLGRP